MYSVTFWKMIISISLGTFRSSSWLLPTDSLDVTFLDFDLLRLSQSVDR